MKKEQLVSVGPFRNHELSSLEGHLFHLWQPAILLLSAQTEGVTLEEQGNDPLNH